jgi:hypothetical protein
LVSPLAGSVYVAAVWSVLIAVYIPAELVLRYTVYAVAPVVELHETVIFPAKFEALGFGTPGV